LNKETWIIAEHFDGRVQPVTFELVSFARKIPGETKIIVIGHPVRPLAEEIARVTGTPMPALSFDLDTFRHCYRDYRARGPQGQVEP
jgi:hypothetical protein